MDKYSVKLTSRAPRDLDRIYRCIAQTLLEKEAALKQVDHIEEAIFSLETMPTRCPDRRAGGPLLPFAENCGTMTSTFGAPRAGTHMGGI